MEKILSQVENLLDFGVTRSQIYDAIPDVSARTLDEYVKRANERAMIEGAEMREQRRHRQRRRIAGYIRDIRQLIDPVDPRSGQRLPAPEPAARARLYGELNKQETLLARIDGTLAPEKLEVVTRQGWDDLTPAELETIRKTGRLPDGRRAEDLDRVN